MFFSYELPAVAVTEHYWKTWRILLYLAVYNPKTVGRYAWQHLPTLKCLMQMAMTGYKSAAFFSCEKEISDTKNPLNSDMLA